MRRASFVLAVAFAAAAISVPAASAATGNGAATLKRTVAQGWLGVDLDPWDADLSSVNVYGSSPNQLDAAAAAGVESIRFPLYWFRVQPYETADACAFDPRAKIDCNELSAEGPSPSDAPYYWSELDAFVGAAAARGIRLLPSVMGAPLWADDPNNPPYSSHNPTGTLQVPIPGDNAQFGAFVAKLAQRYGTNGTFWTGKPSSAKTPITNWQIWNEPDFEWYWPQHDTECVPTTKTTQAPTPCPSVTIKNVDKKSSLVINLGALPSATRAYLNANPTLWTNVTAALTAKKLTRLYWAPTFLNLIKASRTAVKAADPNAKIVLPSLTNMGWIDLESLYKAGGKGYFDAISANIFVATAYTSKAIAYYRSAVTKYGDKSIPMYVGEFSWSSGLGVLPSNHKMKTIITNSSGQAKNLGTTLGSINKAASGSKIIGAFWYRWASPDVSTTDVWDWTGLNKVTGSTVTPKSSLTTFRTIAMGLEGCKTKAVATVCKTK